VSAARTLFVAGIAVVSVAGCLPAPGEGEPDSGRPSGGGSGASGGSGSGGNGTPTGSGGVSGTGGRPGTGGGLVCNSVVGGASGTSDPNDPLNQRVACTSGRRYTPGTFNGETMMPGDRCQGCHVWTISGTIYPTGHEDTYCNGLNGAGITIALVDSQGRKVNLTPNSVGNFYYRSTFVPPFTAKVLRGSTVRAMSTVQCDNTDCNACHTPEGLRGAPGRIVPGI
jgi:hypothetical protein